MQTGSKSDILRVQCSTLMVNYLQTCSFPNSSKKIQTGSRVQCSTLLIFKWWPGRNIFRIVYPEFHILKASLRIFGNDVLQYTWQNCRYGFFVRDIEYKSSIYLCRYVFYFSTISTVYFLNKFIAVLFSSIFFLS